MRIGLRPLALGLTCGILFACPAATTSTPDGGTPNPDGGAPAADGGGGDAGVADGGAPDASGPTDAGAPDAGTPFVYVGTGSGSISIFTADLRTGALTSAGTVATGTAPTFLAVDGSHTHLYAVGEATPGLVLSYSINGASGALTLINQASSGGDGPPFLSVELSGRYVFVANYGNGIISILPILASGGVAAPTTTVAVGQMPHMMIANPAGDFVVVPCLGSDYVAQFLWAADSGVLTANAIPTVQAAPDAGPRHVAFTRDGAFAYVINEVGSTMVAYAFDGSTGRLSAIQTLSTLPAGFSGTNTAAEVQIHPSERFLYGSNRGDDSIVAYALDGSTGRMTVLGYAKTGGNTPRHFSLDPSGGLMLVANQTSNNITALRVDADAGTLTPLGIVAIVDTPEFVGVVMLPGM
jgi:6-phosphogluconolactonase